MQPALVQLGTDTLAVWGGLRLRSHGKRRALRCLGGLHPWPRYLWPTCTNQICSGAGLRSPRTSPTAGITVRTRTAGCPCNGTTIQPAARLDRAGLAPAPAAEPHALSPWECQRWLVTPTCRHMSRTGQVEQRGRTPVQMCLPNGTSRRLISTQYWRGSRASSATIVRSGVVVAT